MILRIKRAHLVLKTPLAVVRPLCLDVLNQRPNIRRTQGEQAISTLPGKVLHALLLHPCRRTALNLRNNLRRNLRRGQAQRQMNMVCNATCAETLAIQLPRCTRQIGVQGFGKVVSYQRPTIFRTENDMHQIEAQRLRHAQNYMSGRQPLSHSPEANLGLRPRLVCHRTLGPHVPHRATHNFTASLEASNA